MRETVARRQFDTADPTGSASHAGDYTLKLVLAYQDAQTRQWARDLCSSVARLVGKDSVQATWHDIRDLHRPDALNAATEMARQSDVIVIAVRASSHLPLAFYYWAHSWLPRLTPEPGALVALIYRPGRLDDEATEIRDYLRRLSRRCCLDFLVQDRSIPAKAVWCRPRAHRGLDSATAGLLNSVAGREFRSAEYRRPIFE